jgi:uncharacterized protein (TIGR03382 family)
MSTRCQSLDPFVMLLHIPAMRRVLACLLFVACEAPAPVEVGGSVVDLTTGAPIAGATIVAEGTERTAHSDRRGRFRIEGERLHASAPGYIGASVTGHHITLWPREVSDTFARRYLESIDRSRRDDPDEPGLRPEARAYLRGEALEVPRAEGDVGVVRASLGAPPATIRIWRRAIDGSTDSCAGRVDVIDLEEYIRGVLPHEWIPSWHDESLRAGAIAIRTYAWGWVERGGKYDCADLDDTTASQVYREGRNDRATAAVDDTTGLAIADGEELVSGEYSAENGDPTAFGVVEPHCTGRELFGHGRGMCQWGSQRWATNDGRDHIWIAEHYYPGGVVESGGPALPDFDATAAGQVAPARMISGERAEAFVEFTNTGRRTWDLGGTRLATHEPSLFYDLENWIAEDRATAPDHSDYATGSLGRFTFMITAPEVSEETVVTETFQLVHDDAFFGPEVSISIRVVPRGGVVPPDEDAGMMRGDAGMSGGLTGGCSAAPGGSSLAPLALLALFAIRRRPTRR